MDIYNMVTFRYRAIFRDKEIRYFIDMADLRHQMKFISLSSIDMFEKYYKSASWTRVWIRF